MLKIRALAGFDENCLDYIEKYTDTPAPVYGLTAEQVAAAKGAVVEQGRNHQQGAVGGVGSSDLNHPNALAGVEARSVAECSEAKWSNEAIAEPRNTRPEGSDSDRRGTPNVVPENLSESEKSLVNIICKGFKDSSAEATKKLLGEGKLPVEIIDRCIVPALDIVGKDFEKNAARRGKSAKLWSGAHIFS